VKFAAHIKIARFAFYFSFACVLLFWSAYAGQEACAQEHPSDHQPDATELGGDGHGSDGNSGSAHDESHAEGHGGGHHDPFDLSAANASAQLEKPEEFRSDLALWTLAVFGLLMLILGKFAWRPICDALEARESAIADNIEKAHRNNEESRRLLAEHEQKIAKASEEAREMMDEARKEAESRKADIIAAAEESAKAEKDRAVREIHAAKNMALEDLAKSSVDQAVGLASRIVGQKLNRDDHASLIQDALQQFPSDN